MFVQLYPYKSLQKTKNFCFSLGIFLTAGSSFALFRETVLSSQMNVLFAYGASIFLLAGVVAIAFAKDKLPVKETYFSMTPERVSFRVSFIGKEYRLRWNSISEIKITDHSILFDLKNGSEVVLRLGAIQLPETAKHVRASIRLAALDQNIKVNGVLAERQRA